MRSILLQPNVMAAWGGIALPLLSFPGMAGRVPQSRRLMITSKPQTRSAEDVRRSAQMAAAQAGDRAAYEALLRDCVPLIKAIAVRRGVPSGPVSNPSRI
jgi:hypothetical protein